MELYVSSFAAHFIIFMYTSHMDFIPRQKEENCLLLADDQFIITMLKAIKISIR